jgi:hypothetical protein
LCAQGIEVRGRWWQGDTWLALTSDPRVDRALFAATITEMNPGTQTGDAADLAPIWNERYNHQI